jgi:hypothetical protein
MLIALAIYYHIEPHMEGAWANWHNVTATDTAGVLVDGGMTSGCMAACITCQILFRG